MKARILDANEAPVWDLFVKRHPMGNVHQCSAWGEFQSKVPARGKFWIVVLEDDEGKIVGGSLVVRYGLAKGFCWFYMPRGPLLDFESLDLNYEMGLLFTALKPLAEEEKAVFLRIDPPLVKLPELKYQRPAAFKDIKHGFQPKTTLILDLKDTEEEILAQMKPKGRYNIRLAEKKGVTVKCYTGEDEVPDEVIDAFYSIFEETTIRDGFKGHKRDFYADMIKTLLPAGVGKLYVAEYEGRIIAGMITTHFLDTTIYYYGASSNLDRNVMAPYLLQWTAIRDAKASGFKFYDFLGIATDDSPKDPWHGITQFKTKFGGHRVDYMPAMEMSFNPVMYFLYKLYKLLRG